MLYFSYGSNMSTRRLQQRIPSADFITVATLHGHALCFHKIGKDSSGKCDAHATGEQGHCVIGVVFDIAETEKPALDGIEGLGVGYETKAVQLSAQAGGIITAYTYVATRIDASLQPYHWYKHHVLSGAESPRVCRRVY